MSFKTNLLLLITLSNDELIVFKGDEEVILKHSFQHSLIYYRNQRIKIKVEDLKSLYKYQSYYNDLDNKTIINNTKERKRINKSIKKLIPFSESQIKKYSNIFYFIFLIAFLKIFHYLD